MRIAIIDIGSNAVRCVVYSDNSIGGYEVYHEKFKLDISALVNKDKINVKHPFYSIIRRFVDMTYKLNVSQIKCVATAAFRDHPKAEELCEDFYSRYGIRIEVISGEQEAFLSSCGLLMGSVQCKGIIADLGGGSLEIAKVISHKITKLTSLPLGTRILSKIADLTINYICEEIKAAAQDLIDNTKKTKLYLIGGGFRVIAREYIRYTKYPLYNLHNLEISKDDLSNYLNYLKQSSAFVFPLQRKNDSFAVLVLESLLELFDPSTIVISNYGLKEGVRFTSLSQEERYKDVIFERCKRLAQYSEGDIDLDGYSNLISTSLVGSKDEKYDMADIAKIALIFLQCKRYIDRNFLNSFLSSTILMVDIPFTHKQRASLALILSHAFGGKASRYINNLANKVLGPKMHHNSIIVACMINILLILDGPELSNKCSLQIQIQDQKIDIQMPNTLPFSLFNSINREIKIIEQIRTKLLDIS